MNVPPKHKGHKNQMILYTYIYHLELHIHMYVIISLLLIFINSIIINILITISKDAGGRRV